ncbi:amino acid transporter [Shewanella hanedai]|jgi:L-lysine exporter family protein LysE/ArgO|uniref:Amino acid transporter n=1 Tax=Shewanella hanedai TaxID=25 RepID=A0A553JKG4_SHEHA|nr:LysE/ArgO family amino acid transporter [Shewanella hanedai]TRY12954.1 amino acid transporter [Shewanella hanedai]GGI90635.1 amino acid transporter [Shewanella hanedai]
MFVSYLAGFSLGLSLILAIGAQNAFVLKQGLKKHHVFVVCFICALSDAVLISLGVAGFGAIVKEFPLIEVISRYAGATFLVIYGVKSFHSAFKTTHALDAEGELPASLMKTVLVCLAFTWLNPHVYLDTFVLLGSISTQYEATKMWFALGAITGSFVFFFTLGYGARMLIPVFQKPVSWKVLEFIIGLIMFAIAASLLVS